MASIGDIVATLRMDSTNFTRGAKKAQTSAGKTGASMSAMGKAAKLAGAAYLALATVKTVGRAFGGLVGAAGDLDRALQKSFAIQKLTTDQQHAMREAAIAVAGDVSASSSEVAEGFFFLASAGLDAEQQIAALPQVAAFAQAGMFDLATATDLATDAQSAIGLTSTDAAENLAGLKRVTDTLVGANTLANASVEQFSKALTSGAGAAAKDVGMEIEEVVAVLAVFADQGIKGELASSQLSIVLRDLQTKAIQNAAAFEDAKIKVFDVNGEFQSMSSIVGNLETRLAGLSDEQRKATLLALGFSDKSVGALQKLLGTSDAIDGYRTKLKGIGGATRDVAANSLTPFDNATNKLAKSWDRLLIKVGTPLVENVVTPLIEDITWAVEKVGAFASNVGTVFNNVKREIRAVLKILEQIPGVDFGTDGPGQMAGETITSEWNERVKAEAKAANAAAATTVEVEKQVVAQKTLNKEVERFSQLTSSAAEGNSVEAYSRIFQTIAAGRQPNVQNQAQKAVAMVKNAAPAIGPKPEAGKEEAKLLNGIIDELRKNTKAVKQLNEDAEGI
jgi:TP901 family phage tail tape measure protein